MRLRTEAAGERCKNSAIRQIANRFKAGYSLGKGEVLSSILSGSTMKPRLSAFPD